MFTTFDPDVFVDTHTSDGADYTYTMTLIATQKDKLNHYVSDFVQQEFLPSVYSNMEKEKFPMNPYVETHPHQTRGGPAPALRNQRHLLSRHLLFSGEDRVAGLVVLRRHPSERAQFDLP